MIERELEPEVMDDPEEAGAYDAMDHSEPNAAFVDRLMALIGDKPVTRAIDLGTGPGDIPILLCKAHPTLSVTAVDLADSMLDLARIKVGQAGLSERISLKRADVKALPYPDASFDVVFSNTILHHIPRPRAMLAEAARVLKPGGVLLIRDLFRPETEASLYQLVQAHAADAEPSQRKMFAQSLRAALTPGELGVLAEEAGLTDFQVVVDTDRHMSLQSR